MTQNNKSGQFDLTGKQLLALHQELEVINQVKVDAGGIEMLPSQCYELTDNPVQIMFNTNCPASLKEKIEGILNRYYTADENSSSQ